MRQIVTEGPDLGGKDTVISVWQDCYRNDGRVIFDVLPFWKSVRQLQNDDGSFGRDPTFDEMFAKGKPDAIFFSEPSYVREGHVLRTDIMNLDRNPSAPIWQVADYFSRDRERIEKNIAGIARQYGIDMIKGRNVFSSLIYQPLQWALREHAWGIKEPSRVSRETVAALPGNAYCLREWRTPHHVFHVWASGPELVRRRDLRDYKIDGLEVETDEFLMNLAPAYKKYLPLICEKYAIPMSFVDTTGTSVQDTKVLAKEWYRKHL